MLYVTKVQGCPQTLKPNRGVLQLNKEAVLSGVAKENSLSFKDPEAWG